MFQKLLSFEWKSHTRKPSFYLMTLFFLVISIGLFSDLQDKSIHANAPYRLNLYIAAMSLLAVFPAMFFTINTQMKDHINHFSEILYSTSISKTQYYLTRLLGIFLASLLVLTIPISGFYLGKYINNEYVTFGEFNLSSYIYPWLIFTLPNTLVISSIVFGISLFSKNAIITYLTGIVLLAIFWTESFYINSPLTGGLVLAHARVLGIVSIADLFGISAFLEQTQFWSIHEKNSLQTALQGNLLINRLLWTGVSIGFMLITYSIFSLRKGTLKDTGKTDILSALTAGKYFTVNTQSNTYQSHLLSLKALFFLELKGILLSKAFLIILSCIGIMNILTLYFSIHGELEFGDRYPTTDLMVSNLSEPVKILGILLVIFYSGDMIWKNRQYKFHEIINGTNVNNLMMLMAKYLVILCLISTIIFMGIMIAISFQLWQNYDQVDLIHYLSIFYHVGLPLFLIAIFAFFFQLLVPHKYGAMIGTGASLLFFSQILPALGFNEPLIQLFYFPNLTHQYSDLNGYGNLSKAFNGFAWYWSALALLLGLLSFRYWKRNPSQAFSLSTHQKHWTGKLILGLAVILLVSSGSYNYYNLNTEAKFLPDDKFWFGEQYEKRFKAYESLPIPQIVDVKTKVDLFPNQLTYEIQGDYVIQNTNEVPINQIFVCSRQELVDLQIEGTILSLKDSLLNSYVFDLTEPLAPGGHLKMSFKITSTTKGFEKNPAIARNGSYISHTYFDPILGYLDRLEISHPEERKKRGLPERERLAYDDPHLQDQGKFARSLVTYETTISTSAAQTALTSGQLIGKWTKNGRNYFHYRADRKIRKNMTYFSAQYAQDSFPHRGIQLNMHYHPDHYHNIPFMAEITKATLDYAIENFGPYPHKSLSFAEVTGGRGFGGQAMPGVISLTEKGMYTKDIRNPEEGINVVARRTIHEVAHQWWSHQLVPKTVAGATILTESLCKYTEAVVLQKLYGKSMVRKLSGYTGRRYFASRSYLKGPEPPLYLTTTQTFLGYSKGYMTLLSLKELLGEKAINQALRSLLKNHGNKGTATSSDLINALYDVSPKKYHTLIDDWMKRVITYDLKVVKAASNRLKNGDFETNIRFEADRYESHESGEAVSIPINEPIQIAAFSGHPDFSSNKSPLYCQAHWINSKTGVLKIITKERPVYVGIDPYLTRLDRDQQDNLRLLQGDD